MDRSRLAVIVPALNEEKSIAAVVTAASGFGVVIVVSDGSTDGTADAASNAGAVVVRHRGNHGYDAALNSGFARAAGLGSEYAITLDADGQLDPAFIPIFTQLFAEGYDVVVGIRPQPGRFSERLFAAYTRVAYRIHDPLCGMKGYAMGLYAELGHVDSYRSIGTELMLYGARGGHPIAEVRVPVAARRGTSRMGGRLRGNARILRALTLAIFLRHPNPAN